MTPAVQQLDKNNLPYILHEYQHDANETSYGLEAAKQLDADSRAIFKTLVVSTELNQLAVAIVPVEQKLNLKKAAKALKAKKVHMADPQKVQNSTGYILGGVSPFGQKKRLTTIIDASALSFNTIFVSGGKRGLEIETSTQTFNTLLNASFIELT